jgi:hypothetical protein
VQAYGADYQRRTEIARAAGRSGYPTDAKSPLAYFADNQAGFAALDITERAIDLTFVSATGQTLHRATVAQKLPE